MKLEPEIINILQNAAITGNQLKITQRLDRAIYARVNKALECLGGKWNKGAQAHIFESDPRELIRAAGDTGKVTDAKKEFQFFPTPPPLARKLVALANLQPKDLILEPSAGHGAIIDAIVEAELADGRTRNDILSRVRLCELMPANQAVLKKKGYSNIMADDFLTLDPNACRFDKIIANPPFTKDQDITHVRKMYDVLKPGGMIVTLTSPGWTFNDRRKQSEFRQWIEGESFFTEEIPGGTFDDTDVRTMLIAITKPLGKPVKPVSDRIQVIPVNDDTFRQQMGRIKRATVTVQPSLF